MSISAIFQSLRGLSIVPEAIVARQEEREPLLPQPVRERRDIEADVEDVDQDNLGLITATCLSVLGGTSALFLWRPSVGDVIFGANAIISFSFGALYRRGLSPVEIRRYMDAVIISVSMPSLTYLGAVAYQSVARPIS